MSIMSRILKQCRRPTGWLGRSVARGMNRSHSRMTDWGLSHVSIGKRDTILDVETHYFWPDLIQDMKEVLRVLKPGGTLVVMGGEYKGGKYDERNERWVELGDMAYHTLDEFEALLSDAGLTEVQVLEDYDKGWMCSVGRKPICV